MLERNALQTAAALHAVALLRLASSGGGEPIAGRLCDVNHHRYGDGLWAQILDHAGAGCVPCFPCSVDVDCSTEQGHLSFRTEIIGRRGAICPRRGGEQVCWLLAWPSAISRREQRREHRVAVQETGICVHLCRHGSVQEISARLHDLSTSGVGLLLSVAERAGQFAVGDALQVVLQAHGSKLALTGRVANVQQFSKGIRLGIEFAGLDTTSDGRRSTKILSDAVSELQRSELRRVRRQSA